MLTITGVELAPDVEALVGVEIAEMAKFPRKDGFQVQVTEWLEPDPEVNLFLQPGSTFPFTKKETFDATETFAVTETGVLKVAVVTPPARARELNVEVKLRA